jgi:outer membrane lipoprotein SlyB
MAGASAGGAMAPATSPNATVAAIEVVPSEGAAGATEGAAGSAAMGSSSGGATGSSPGSDRTYRITLRMDDGSTQVVSQASTPDFRSGDRVTLAGGTIQH